MPRRRRGQLSDDDLAVWRQVARTAAPLDRRQDRSGAPPASPKPKPEAESPPDESPTTLRPFRIGAAARDESVGHVLAPTIAGQLAAQPVRMDRKTFTRLKRGKLKPERKLDLHGMTLAQAHPALRGFIRAAHGDGLRLVVVITGKGRGSRDEGGPIPTPRGVLRHQVPGWLHAPDLRPYVLQVTDAHFRHGGDGAYYVYLTRGAAGGARRG